MAGGNFQGSGVNLTAVCWGARNGFARKLASSWNVPVRAATRSTITDAVTGETLASTKMAWRAANPKISFWSYFGRFRTIYPSRLKTAWVDIFGY